jgi:CDP-glycerol glycerophosphotransferase (TagB/SpsB family)
MMSALKSQILDYFSKRARYGIREFISKFIYVFVSMIFGWCIIIPLSRLIPRRGKHIIFIGRESGYFIDNVKYLYIKFLKTAAAEYKPIFLTEDSNEQKRLTELSIHAVLYPSLTAIKLLLTCPVVIVDHDTWVFKFRFFFLHHAIKIQLWHGVGFKYIGIKKIKKEIENRLLRSGLIVLYKIIGLIPKYDIFISTSEFYTHEVFEKSYRAKEFIEAGYPRNDIIFYNMEEIKQEQLYFLNTDTVIAQQCLDYKKKEFRLVLYAPTFRDSGGDPINDGALDLNRLNEFAQNNNLLFIFKFHPDPHFHYPMISYSHILRYNPRLDIYPLFSVIDLLITDYSAIYTDFLLTKRPVLFFPYDMHKYIKHDRPLQFDYDSITPGPKCFTQTELQEEIERIITKGNDIYAHKRHAALKKTFKHCDSLSSERIIDILLKQVSKKSYA